MAKVYSTVSRQRIRLPQMGPQDPKDVTRDTARDLSGLAGERAALKADAHHWLTGAEYGALRYRLEDAHAAVEAALVEARRKLKKAPPKTARLKTTRSEGPSRKRLRTRPRSWLELAVREHRLML